ncbi:HAMP domain-containing sensor histidine kinase [[Clostridium] dakarense]|uniref:HAMP domain-containing sensor histidine kinase n=1 Tax=Faecalimicrobium dakarense TaxID=1301100 RepID=UPI0004B55A10|nr:HAMP domain-containing sensor histidine kinase [[Clostridium] dakarense]
MGNIRVKDNYIGKKISIFTGLICLFIIVSFIYSIIILKDDSKKEGKTNLLRVETSTQREKIKEMYKNNNFYMEESFYDYCVINLRGEVIFSILKDFKKGDKVNLEADIGYDNSFSKRNKSNNSNELVRYSTPLVNNNVQEGTIIIDLPKAVTENGDKYEKFIPLWTLLFLIGILTFMINRFVKVDIINPIKELHKSAKNILRGNYDCKIRYDYHGEVGEFCHDFEDMRDEIIVSKEKEERLKKSEKELLACISHDLKTPLSSILGYVEGIRDGIVHDEEGIKRYSNIIIKKSKELSKLIDDILEQSKAELNEMTIERKEMYSYDYLTETLMDLSIDVANKNMKLNIIGDIPNSLISIDEKRMNQVISNIISNSIKYSELGKIIDVWVDNDINSITVNIKDYGSGISIGDIPFVFNKFYRGEKYRNTNISGSGLGLSISKYIVESHGGVIKCLSSLKEGTTISFTIPKI